jgi:hypothetical protein
MYWIQHNVIKFVSDLRQVGDGMQAIPNNCIDFEA